MLPGGIRGLEETLHLLRDPPSGRLLIDCQAEQASSSSIKSTMNSYVHTGWEDYLIGKKTIRHPAR